VRTISLDGAPKNFTSRPGSPRRSNDVCREGGSGTSKCQIGRKTSEAQKRGVRRGSSTTQGSQTSQPSCCQNNAAARKRLTSSRSNLMNVVSAIGSKRKSSLVNTVTGHRQWPSSDTRSEAAGGQRVRAEDALSQEDRLRVLASEPRPAGSQSARFGLVYQAADAGLFSPRWRPVSAGCRGTTDRRAPGELADARAGSAASGVRDAVGRARVAGSRDGRDVDWVRPSPRQEDDGVRVLSVNLVQ
jgi:hypothetical protein